MKDEYMADSLSEIKPVLAGEKGAFESFVRKYERLVSHIVFRMVKNTADREDLCQDVFMTIYAKLNEFRHQSQLSTWIGRIAHNKCLNFLEKKRVPLFDDVTGEDQSIDNCIIDNAGPDDNSERSDIGARVRREIDQLPVLYGTILALYHLEEMPYREIGQIMNLPDGTVKSYLFRARQMLKERLQDRYRPEELWQ
ncbi:MAG: sigma-70 family RNA polymerase sigma factor [bacterium]